jgi:hypothetical protein
MLTANERVEIWYRAYLAAISSEKPQTNSLKSQAEEFAQVADYALEHYECALKSLIESEEEKIRERGV